MTGTPTDTSAFEAFEARGWQERAAGYDAFFRDVTAAVVGPLLDAARVGPGTRLLDLATGPGHVAGTAAARGALASGIDVAPAMVAIAERAWPQVTFHQGDAHDLPFPDASFDAVTASFALLHFGRPEQAAREIARVLVPDGRVAATVWDPPERVALFSAVLGAMETCGVEPPNDLPEGPAFFRFSDEDELRALLDGNGFRSVAVRSVTFEHRVRDAEQVWRGVLDGTVRTAALLRGQTPDVQDRLRAAFAEKLERHRQGSELVLPISVKLASATRSG